jgi:hypothetical protein
VLVNGTGSRLLLHCLAGQTDTDISSWRGSFTPVSFGNPMGFSWLALRALSKGAFYAGLSDKVQSSVRNRSGI